MTEKEIISALLYGVISMLVAYAWIFFYASSIVGIRHGNTTAIEVLGKVLLTHIGLVFVFILIFHLMDIFLPPEFKAGKALQSFWGGYNSKTEPIYQYWLDQMKNYHNAGVLDPGAAPKYYSSMIIFYILLVLYIVDLLLPFIILFLAVVSVFYINRFGSGADESMLLKVFKSMFVYIGILLLCYIHMKIGSAAIQPFLDASNGGMGEFDLYGQMNKHLYNVFK